MICYLGFSRICETTCLELNDKLVNRIISIFSLQLHFSKDQIIWSKILCTVMKTDTVKKSEEKNPNVSIPTAVSNIQNHKVNHLSRNKTLSK